MMSDDDPLADDENLSLDERARRGIERAKLAARQRRRELGLPELPPDERLVAWKKRSRRKTR